MRCRSKNRMNVVAKGFNTKSRSAFSRATEQGRADPWLSDVKPDVAVKKANVLAARRGWYAGGKRGMCSGTQIEGRNERLKRFYLSQMVERGHGDFFKGQPHDRGPVPRLSGVWSEGKVGTIKKGAKPSGLVIGAVH